MRKTLQGLAGIAGGLMICCACERSLEGAACACVETQECCFGIDRCRPKGECPQPKWRGAWSTDEPNIAPRECGPLIDDLEDDTGVICLDQGRVGAWYSFNDSKGRQFPDSTPGTPIRPSLDPELRSRFAMHTYFNHDVSAVNDPEEEYFAGVGVDLKFDGKRYGHYDASAYAGITFVARGSAPHVSARVNTVDTTYVDFAGTCTSACSAWEAPIALTDSWQRYSVRFDELRSERCPVAPCPVDPAKLTNIQFLFVRDYTSDEVHLWLDDVAFF